MPTATHTAPHTAPHRAGPPPVAVVTGVSGQDGSYLAQLLLAQGYRVIGSTRDPARAAATLAGYGLHGVELQQLDLYDGAAMADLLARSGATEVYNLAAMSSGAGMFDDPLGIADSNGLVVARWLEAIRGTNPAIRFCQAGSSELFGDALETPQHEASAMRPRTPYGAAKLYAHAMVQIYRQRFGLHASTAILYNHESPRRGLGFVTRRVSRHAAMIALGLADELVLGPLDARRDWGFAGDTVRALWLMLQQPKPDNYVVATGVTHSVAELCACAFGQLGLDWQHHVRSQPQADRAAEGLQLVGDASLARSALGWAPQLSFQQLVAMMVQADWQALRSSADAPADACPC